MRFLSTVFSIPLLFSFAAQARHEVKNGGDAVVCYTAADRQTVTSVESFDYWEGQRVHPVVGGVQLGAGTLKQKINLAIARLQAFDHERARKVGNIANSIVDHISDYLVTGAQLPEIDDAQPRLIPNSPCYIEQFAVQWKDPVSGQRRFAISNRFYADVNTADEARAGIILHEAMYRVAILEGSTNSDGVRYLNYLFSTSYFTGRPQEDYERAYLDAKINPQCKVKNVFPGHKNVVVKPAGAGSSDLILCTPLKIERPKFKLEMAAGEELFFNSGDGYWWSGSYRTNLSFFDGVLWTETVAKTGSVITYLSDGLVSGVQFAVGTPHIKFANVDLTCLTGSSVIFDNDGGVRGCELQPGQTYTHFGQVIHPKSLWFSKSYVLLRAWFEQPATFPIANTLMTAHVSGVASFNAAGELLYAQGLATPLPITVLGHLTTTNHFTVNPLANEITAYDVFVETTPDFQGKRVGYFRSDELYASWANSQLCEAKGLGTANWEQPTRSTLTYVAAPEEIYVIDEKRIRYVTDQEIYVLDPPRFLCTGDFKVTL